jgi:hypothetical protein
MRKIILCVLFILALSSAAFAQNRYLRGLAGISVKVTVFDEDKILSPAQIKSDVELELRKAGIKVFDDDSTFGATPSVARLYVLVNSIHVTGGTYACYTSLEVQERVSLERKPSERLIAGIWEQAEMTTADRSNDLRQARDGITEITKTLANAFLAANPK